MSDELEPTLVDAVTENTGDGEKGGTPDSIALVGGTTVYSSVSELRHPLRLLGSIFSEFWNGRELAWRIFIRNLNALYRQTLLGLFWAILPPLANTAIWIFLRSQKVFELEATEIDPTVFILTGMILWQAFIDAFQVPAEALNKNRGMLSRLNFPREALLMVGLGEVIFNLGIRILLLIPAFIFFKVSISASMLLAIPVIVLMTCLAMAMGLFVMPVGSL